MSFMSKNLNILNHKSMDKIGKHVAKVNIAENLLFMSSLTLSNLTTKN